MVREMTPTLSEGEHVQLNAKYLSEYKMFSRELNELIFNRDFLLRQGTKSRDEMQKDPQIAALNKRILELTNEDPAKGDIGILVARKKMLDSLHYREIVPNRLKLDELKEKINRHSNDEKDQALKSQKGELFALMKERGVLAKNNNANRNMIALLEVALMKEDMPRDVAEKIRNAVEGDDKVREVDVSKIKSAEERQNILNYLKGLGVRASVSGDKLLMKELTPEEIAKSGVKAYSFRDSIYRTLDEFTYEVLTGNIAQFDMNEEAIKLNRQQKSVYALASNKDKIAQLDTEYEKLMDKRKALAVNGHEIATEAKVLVKKDVEVVFIPMRNAPRSYIGYDNKGERVAVVPKQAERAQQAPAIAKQVARTQVTQAQPQAPAAVAAKKPAQPAAPELVFGPQPEKKAAPRQPAPQQAPAVSKPAQQAPTPAAQKVAAPYAVVDKATQDRIAREKESTKGTPMIEQGRRLNEALGTEWVIHTYSEVTHGTNETSGYTQTIATRSVKTAPEREAEKNFWQPLMIEAQKWVAEMKASGQALLEPHIDEDGKKLNALVNQIIAHPQQQFELPVSATSPDGKTTITRILTLTPTPQMVEAAKKYRDTDARNWANERYELLISNDGASVIYLSHTKDKGLPGGFYRDWWQTDLGDAKYVEKGVTRNETNRRYSEREKIDHLRGQFEYDLGRMDRKDVEKKTILPSNEDLLALRGTPAEQKTASDVQNMLLDHAGLTGTGAVAEVPSFSEVKKAYEDKTQLDYKVRRADGTEVTYGIDVDERLFKLMGSYTPVSEGTAAAQASQNAYECEDAVRADEKRIRDLMQVEINSTRAGLPKVDVPATLPLTESMFFDNVAEWNLAKSLAQGAGVYGDANAIVEIPSPKVFEDAAAKQGKNAAIEYKVRVREKNKKTGVEEEVLKTAKIAVDDRMMELLRNSPGIPADGKTVKVGEIDGLLVQKTGKTDGKDTKGALDFSGSFGMAATIEKPSNEFLAAVQKLIADKRSLALANDGRYDAEKQVVSYWYGQQYNLVGNYNDNWQIFRGEISTYGKTHGLVYTYLYVNTRDKQYTLSAQDKLNNAWVVSVFADDNVTVRRVAVGMSNDEIRQSERKGVTPFAFRIYEQEDKPEKDANGNITRAGRKLDEQLMSSLVYLPTSPKLFGCHLFSRGVLETGMSKGVTRRGTEEMGHYFKLKSDRPKDVFQVLYDIKRYDDREKGANLVFYPGKTEVRSDFMRKTQVQDDTGAFYNVNTMNITVRRNRLTAYLRTTGEAWGDESDSEARTRDEKILGARYDLGTLWKGHGHKLLGYAGAETRSVMNNGVQAPKENYATTGMTYYKTDSKGRQIVPFPEVNLELTGDQQGIRSTRIRAESFGHSRVGGFFNDTRGADPQFGLTYREGWTANQSFSFDTSWEGGRWKDVNAYLAFKTLNTRVGYDAIRNSISFGLDHSF